MKTLLSLLLALSMAISPIQACASKLPKNVMTTTHRIEMTVTVPDAPATENEFSQFCSSTAISPHALLTATHCDLGASTVNVDGTPAAIMSRIVDDNDHTVYILYITFSKYAKFGKMPKIGDEVWLRGNPYGLNQLIRYGHYSGTIVLATAEVVFMFDINGGPGDSGSAIFDKHGNIVAVTHYEFSGGGFVMLGTSAFHFTPAQLAQATK